jgi:hypothetical protein
MLIASSIPRPLRWLITAICCALALCACADSAQTSPQDRLAAVVLVDKGDPIAKFDDHGATVWVYVIDRSDVGSFIAPPAGFRSEDVSPPYVTPDGLRLVQSNPGWADRSCVIKLYQLDDTSLYPRTLPDDTLDPGKVLVHAYFSCELG